MRAPMLIHSDVPAAPLIDGERLARTLDSLFRAHAHGGSCEGAVLDGLIALIPCDVVSYAQVMGDGSRLIASRVRLRAGWSGIARSRDDEWLAPGGHLIDDRVKAPDGTDVSYGCARAWRPFDALDRQLLELVRPCVVHIVAEHPSMDAVLRSMPLTGREIEVLTHVARGLTNAQVAARLYVAPGTVKKHLDHIYRKLGVKGRTEAAARISWRMAEREGMSFEP